ncbi:hypothetical protein GZH46_02640 [Fragariocoptes setiger]|uniref:Cardioactive peptide n=1 Tax=Fragariocoptes setiger TaxID=1670756 RepID=A0ABQ7S615_9ACAR|nr:hypothetical protein GZH46_02640 [Fragariocoptes setiger]
MASVVQNKTNITVFIAVVILIASSTTILSVQIPMRFSKRPFCNTFTGCGEKRSQTIQPGPYSLYHTPKYSSFHAREASLINELNENIAKLSRLESQRLSAIRAKRVTYPPLLSPQMTEDMYSLSSDASREETINSELQDS